MAEGLSQKSTEDERIQKYLLEKKEVINEILTRKPNLHQFYIDMKNMGGYAAFEVLHKRKEHNQAYQPSRALEIELDTTNQKEGDDPEKDYFGKLAYQIEFIERLIQ